MRKPKVFISHSSKDKSFINKVIQFLKDSGIETWVDENEISVGDSIRAKIFENGFRECDIFFTYFSDNSIDSYWVKKEVDAITALESNEKRNVIAPFVSSEVIRNKLPFDIQALKCPILNDDDFEYPLLQLIAKAYSAYADGRKKYVDIEKNEVIQLKNDIIENIKLQLKRKKYKSNHGVISLYQILENIENELFEGLLEDSLLKEIRICLGKSTIDFRSLINDCAYESDILDDIKNLDFIKIDQPNKSSPRCYHLTDEGKQILNY